MIGKNDEKRNAHFREIARGAGQKRGETDGFLRKNSLTQQKT